MTARWNVKTINPDLVGQLASGLGVCRLTATVLAARGFENARDAELFFNPTLSSLPDPLGIPGMAVAVKFLADAIGDGSPLWVYTDFDADGITSAALLATFFNDIGVKCRTRLPRRDREGYGLHVSVLEEIHREGGGTIITADCGVTAVKEAKRARELGIGLVITDHHNPTEELPQADGLVNPKLEGCEYPDPMIAGVGVAWNLAAALRRELSERGWFSTREAPDMKGYLELAALGTVADVVPLKNVNRVIVHFGIKRMNAVRSVGINALAQVAGVDGGLRAGHLAFQLAPRINAAGRMDDPARALELLICPDPAKAGALASHLDKLNRQRRDEESGVLESARSTVEENGWNTDNWSIVVDGDCYHQGVIGIVASKLVEAYHRPTIVLSVDGETAKGSARSIPGFDLHEALGDCDELLIRYGGHKAAAGMTLETANIPEFRDAFEKAVRARLAEEDLTPSILIDAVASPVELDMATLGELDKLEPFGFGNPTPVFRLDGVTVKQVKAIGRDGVHIGLTVEAGGSTLDVVGWGKAVEMEGIRPGDTLDLVGNVRVRTWRGSSTIQFTLKDFRT